jgi:hypothetical protein
MDEEFVIYNGERVPKRWFEEMEKAQRQTTYEIRGREYQRVRYGDEKEDWGADHAPCHDCGVWKGQYHFVGCDVERCPACDGQVISCDCSYADDEDESDEETSAKLDI